MKWILLIAACILVVTAIAQQDDDPATLVPSTWPVYVNGKAVSPRDGGHRILLDRARGLVVDDMVYLPLTKTPPFVPPVKADGMHYVHHIGMAAANQTLESGGSRDQAKQSMIDRWRSEFGDKVTWKEDPADRYQVTLNYQGQALVMIVPADASYHPEKQAPDNFDALKSMKKELVTSLKNGALVLCGQTYLNVINPADAEEVLKEIRALPSEPKALTMVGGETVFANVTLLDGKYTLTNSAVRDLSTQR